LNEDTLRDKPEQVAAWLQWLAAWKAKLLEEGLEEGERQAVQKSANPKFIPRQHLLQVRWVMGRGRVMRQWQGGQLVGLGE
jgi:uncharacterized protein YdiU (UPF0061 family)